MDLQIGYVYDIIKTEKRIYSDDYISKYKYIYMGKAYLGDITGFGDTEYHFIKYQDNLHTVNKKDIINILVKCGENPEEVIGKCMLDEDATPYNIKFERIVIEQYKFDKKKCKIVYE